MEINGFEYAYRDRDDAGRVLAEKLSGMGLPHPFVCAVPNGGVAVAIPIARALQAPLRLVLVRKLPFPENPEAGFGAVTADGFVVLNHELVKVFRISHAVVEGQKAKALESLRLRRERFGAVWTHLPPLENASVIVVDDGLASGSTMEAAVMSLRAQKPGALIVAVPTASMGAVRRLEALADRVVCPHIGRLRRFAVADAYAAWCDLEDEAVLEMLRGFHSHCEVSRET